MVKNVIPFSGEGLSPPPEKRTIFWDVGGGGGGGQVWRAQLVRTRSMKVVLPQSRMSETQKPLEESQAADELRRFVHLAVPGLPDFFLTEHNNGYSWFYEKKVMYCSGYDSDEEESEHEIRNYLKQTTLIDFANWLRRHSHSYLRSLSMA